MKANKVVAQDAAKRAIAKGARHGGRHGCQRGTPRGAAAGANAATTRNGSTATLGDMKQISQGQNKEFEGDLLAMQQQHDK